MKTKQIIAIVLFFFISNCFKKNKTIVYLDKNNASVPASNEERQKQYDTLVSSDPCADLKNALRLEDKRYIGITTFTALIPAAKSNQIRDRILDSGQVKFIAGTHHSIFSDAPNLNEVATEYAERYNYFLAKQVYKSSEFEPPKSEKLCN